LGPDDQILSRGVQLPEHLLRLKALLVALVDAQSLLILLDLCFDTVSPQVVEVDIGRQDSQRVVFAASW
jgi:hypothetical protein